MPILTAIDILGVQRYVFASNRLRDVISASWLVDWATAVDGALGGWADHVIMAAGANAILNFESPDEARRFAGRYTRRLIDDAPRLEATIVHHEYQRGQLALALRALQARVVPAKLGRTPSAEQLGLSVTASCQTTGLPATGIDRVTGRPAAANVLRWREVRARAEARWAPLLDEDVVFPGDLDELGRSRGDTSLLGVVHVDGNGVGERIGGWLDGCTGLPDDVVRGQYREWSSAVNGLVRGMFAAVLARVRGAIVDGTIRSSTAGLAVTLSWLDSGRAALPLRPVLLGGDDLTFLCDGRLGLDLAAEALAVFATTELPHLGRLSACAGVALVPVHHPFSRAYEMAESLCTHAKARRREAGDAGAWIDWQVGPTRPGEPVALARQRTLRVRHGASEFELTCRPYRLGNGPLDPESWRWLTDTVLGGGRHGLRSDVWKERRNKVKALGVAVREGPEAVSNLVAAWRAIERSLALPDGLDDSGFFDRRRTPLLDAVELLDIHLPLEPAVATAAAREISR